jgi:hypothetical protein
MKITCTNCQKSLAIDETKLPMKEVTFPCPSCQTKLIVDRRTFAPAVPSSESGPHPVVAEDHEFGRKALLVGVDDPAVRQAAREIGYQTVHFPTPEASREFYLQEYPEVVFMRPQQMSPPPLAEMSAVLSVSPVDRRRGFFILVAENLRSLDGNAAFLYNVNLVVATKDLPSFPTIFHDAETYHQRLYQQMTALAKQV